MNNTETNSSYSSSRYPRSTEARERRNKRNVLKDIGLGAAAIGVFTLAAFNSDKVDEPPRPVEQTTTIDHIGGNTQVDVQYEESLHAITPNEHSAINQLPANEALLVDVIDEQGTK